MNIYKTAKVIVLFVTLLLSITSINVYATDSEMAEHSILVSSYEELTRALQEDNGYSTIYLGADITSTETGIAINSNKTDVIIDGHPPDAPADKNYTFKQYDSNVASATIYIDAHNTATKNITLQNMNVTGANFYGIVFIPENLSGVSLICNNMEYTGPQVITNRSGTARFIDSTFTMESTTDPTLEKLAEANQIEMGGQVDIPSSDLLSLLWLTNDNAQLRILENATVVLNGDEFLLHADTVIPDIHIHAGASFTLTTKSGVTYLGENVRNFTVDENAFVSISQNAPQTHATLRVEQKFEMHPNSSFFLVRMGYGIGLYFPVPGGSAIFNDPLRAFLYSPGYPSIAFAEEGNLEIYTSSINMWHDLSPNFGTPSYIWNNLGGTPFSVSGKYFDMTPSEITHTLDENAPIQVPLTKELFDLETAALVSLGHTNLSIQPLFLDSTSLVGKTESGATVEAFYQTETGSKVETKVTADNDGNFSIPIDADTLSTDQLVIIEANKNSLTIREMIYPLDSSARKLAFVSIPDEIAFGDIPIPYTPSLAPRDEKELTLSVTDTRSLRDPWSIAIRVASPLTATLAETTHTLPDALVFMGEEATILNNEPLKIYTSSSSPYGESKISWGENTGVLLNIIPGTMYSNVTYQGTLEWLLIDAP